MTTSEWIEPALVKAFEAEGTDAYRICTYPDGWVERYGSDVLISYKNDVVRERLTTELYLWSLAVGFKFSRVFVRFLPKHNAEREAPRLVVGDAGSVFRATAMERQLRYAIDFEAGYSVGLFVDQRQNRSFVRQLQPKALLNCFAYTCAFSVAGAHAGAKTVSVDLSKKSLVRGRENFGLNSIPIDDHRFVAEDVFEYLPRLLRRGEKFDVIILDPPTFSRTHRGKTFQVEHDFEKLFLQALEVAERDAKILLSTNCTTLNERGLQVMARFCLKASRRAGSLHSEAPLPDFPRGAGAGTVWLTLR
ncbi:MAG: class I SAM-dependent methyltransferase [Chthoniobacterales bacterium]|nr:class I SAM-dependent methyltransferase [Chthoniobacterales bacterium]